MVQAGGDEDWTRVRWSNGTTEEYRYGVDSDSGEPVWELEVVGHAEAENEFVRPPSPIAGPNAGPSAGPSATPTPQLLLTPNYS